MMRVSAELYISETNLARNSSSYTHLARVSSTLSLVALRKRRNRRFALFALFVAYERIASKK